MIDDSREAFIVELAPGSYWRRSENSHSAGGSVGCASLATPVYPGGTAYNLELFPLGAFPNVRLVKILITARELSPPYTRYAELLLDWVTRLVIQRSFTADEEEDFQRQLGQCLFQMSPEDRTRLAEPLCKLQSTLRLKVFLDDERPVPEGWVGAKTAAGAVLLLRHATVTHLSLDHDLGDERGTGYDVACWLEKAVEGEAYPMPVVTIHSGNPVGRANIQRVLDSIERRLELGVEGGHGP